MSDAVIAVLCGLSAAVAWGITDFWAAKASRSVGPVTSVIAASLIGLVGFSLFYFLSGHRVTLAVDLWYSVAAGMALGGGLMIFFQALKLGPVSLVSPLSSAYPFVTTILVVILFQAELSVQQVLGIFVVMLGVLAASELFSVRKRDRRLTRGPALAFIVAGSWGLTWAFQAQALETIDWQTASLIQLIFASLTCILLAPIVKDEEKVFRRANMRSLRNKFIIGAGLLQMSGMVIVNVGVERDVNLAPVVAAVSACYPVLTILLALKHFKEEFKLVPIGGAVLTIAGVVMLSLG